MALMNQAKFAAHIGRSQAYVSQLKHSGRLVMQGRMVNAEQSVARIEETQSPEKSAVADRHAAARQKPEAKAATDEIIGGQDINAGHPGSYQHARAMKEKYNALQAQIEYEKAIKLLLPIDEVKAAVAVGDAVVRNRLESMPDILSPLLASETDEQKIRALLMDHVEQLLGELSLSFHNLVK